MPTESPQNNVGRVDPYALDEPSAYPETLPTPLEPAPERYQGWNFPYRGGQTHGVEPLLVSEELWNHEQGGHVEVQEPVPDPNPVPVRIVDTAAHEYSQWRAYQTVATPNPGSVVNRKEGRQSLSVKNMGTVNVFVGPDANVSAYSGWPLEPGAELSLSGEAEVWAVSADLSSVPLAVYFQFATAER